MKPYVYFAVPKRHKFTKQLADMDAKVQAAHGQWLDILKMCKLPAEALLVSNNQRLVGFGSEPRSIMQDWVRAHADAWRWVKSRQGVGYAAPRRTGVGKALALHIGSALSKGHRGDLEECFGISRFFTDTTGGGCFLVSMSLHRPKGKLPMLGVPWAMYKDHKEAFKGMKELTTSAAAEIMGADRS